jgi:hypothetical protein
VDGSLGPYEYPSAGDRRRRDHVEHVTVEEGPGEPGRALLLAPDDVAPADAAAATEPGADEPPVVRAAVGAAVFLRGDDAVAVADVLVDTVEAPRQIGSFAASPWISMRPSLFASGALAGRRREATSRRLALRPCGSIPNQALPNSVGLRPDAELPRLLRRVQISCDSLPSHAATGSRQDA